MDGDIMQSIKSDIEELKELANSTEMTSEEKKIITKFLNYIRLNIKLSIFNKVISSKDEVTELVASIDNLIFIYEQSLRSSVDDNGYSFKIKRLNEIKISILENNYEYFVQDIINDFQDEQELIDMCSLSLSSDYRKFETYFGKPMVSNDGKSIHGYKIDEETVDRVFSIIMNRPLNKNINSYVLALKSSQKFDFKLKQLKNRRELFEKCIENHDTLEEFIRTLIELSTEKEEYEKYESVYRRNNNVIQVIDSGSFLERLSKKFERAKRVEENSILEKDYLQTQRERITTLEEKRNNLFTKLADVGLEYVLIQLENKIKRVNEKVIYKIDQATVDNYDHVAHTLFNELIAFNNKSISSKDTRCQREINLADDLYSLILEEKQKYIAKKENIFYNMDADGQTLINDHLSDCVKIFELENSDRRYCVSPMLSAFIIRVISKLKGISFNDLSETFLNESDQNKLKKDYDDFINRKIGEVYNQISRLKDDEVPINNL